MTARDLYVLVFLPVVFVLMLVVPVVLALRASRRESPAMQLSFSWRVTPQ